jgi:hypothetical protein
MQIVKHQPDQNPDDPREAYIRAMFALYVQCPGRDTRDATGAYSLGEIGETAPKNWSKATPYSLAQPKESDDTITLEIEALRES